MIANGGSDDTLQRNGSDGNRKYAKVSNSTAQRTPVAEYTAAREGLEYWFESVANKIMVSGEFPEEFSQTNEGYPEIITRYVDEIGKILVPKHFLANFIKTFKSGTEYQDGLYSTSFILQKLMSGSYRLNENKSSIITDCEEYDINKPKDVKNLAIKIGNELERTNEDGNTDEGFGQKMLKNKDYDILNLSGFFKLKKGLIVYKGEDIDDKPKNKNHPSVKYPNFDKKFISVSLASHGVISYFLFNTFPESEGMENVVRPEKIKIKKLALPAGTFVCPVAGDVNQNVTLELLAFTDGKRFYEFDDSETYYEQQSN